MTKKEKENEINRRLGLVCVYHYHYNNGYVPENFKETRTHRKTSNNTFVEMVTYDIYGEKVNLTPIIEWEDQRNTYYNIERFCDFVEEKFLMRRYPITDDPEIIKKEFEKRNEIKCKNELDSLVEYYHLEQDNLITTETINATNSSGHIIYFLYDDDKIVYVGQSVKGISRPFVHSDKNWNKIVIKHIPNHIDLNIVESFYISKYKPYYNKGRLSVAYDRFKRVIRDFKELMS